MKKWIIVFLIISNNLYAGIGLRLEIGNTVQYGSSRYFKDIPAYKQYYSDTFIFYDFKYGLNHRIYSGLKCWFIKNDNFSNSPFRQIYTMGYKMQYGKVFLNLKHFCDHAVYSSNLKKYWEYNKYGSQMTTISIGIEFK